MTTVRSPANVEPKRHADQGLLAHLMVVTHFVQKHTLDQLTLVAGYEKLSMAYVDYITRLAERDHSPGELAERIGVSKQLCSKVIRELETLGLIDRRMNLADNRSSVLSLNGRGRELLQEGVVITNAMQQDFADTVGADRLQQLIHVLEKVSLRLEVPLLAFRAFEETDGAPAAHRPSRLNLLLPQLEAHFRRGLADYLSGKGFHDLRPGVGQILAMISREGKRIQYIASILGVTKQSAAVTAAELEQRDYIVREPDPSDKRQICLRLAPKGERLLAEARVAVADIERSIKKALSAAEYQLLEETMATLYLEVADQYDSASVLRAKIHRLSSQLLDELGVTGARALAQHLMTLSRGTP